MFDVVYPSRLSIFFKWKGHEEEKYLNDICIALLFSMGFLVTTVGEVTFPKN